MIKGEGGKDKNDKKAKEEKIRMVKGEEGKDKNDKRRGRKR